MYPEANDISMWILLLGSDKRTYSHRGCRAEMLTQIVVSMFSIYAVYMALYQTVSKQLLHHKNSVAIWKHVPPKYDRVCYTRKVSTLHTAHENTLLYNDKLSEG